MLAGRLFVLEGDKVITERREGIPFTDGSREEIAKGYFTPLEQPVVTWVNGKGDLKHPMEMRSTYDLGSEFADATHVRLVADDEKHQDELVLFISPRFR